MRSWFAKIAYCQEHCCIVRCACEISSPGRWAFASLGPNAEFFMLLTTLICGFKRVALQLLLKVLQVDKYFSSMRKAAVLTD
jgi:hypothetical protein